MTYLGIDLHTRNMTICAVSSNGKKAGEWKLANDTDQLYDLIRDIGGPIKAVVEATSSWYWLAGLRNGPSVGLKEAGLFAR